jgi:hypothetical protein
VYDHDPDDVSLLGWEEFLARQWETIFAGYRRPSGLRKTCRRWSDLIEAGLRCPQDIADALVRAAIVDRADRDLEGTVRAADLIPAMAEVVAGLEQDIAGLDWIGPQQREVLLERHRLFQAAIWRLAFGTETCQAAGD